MIKVKSNANSVIARLRRYRKGFDAKLHTLLERLAEIGIDTAEVRFRTAQYDGTNDVTVNAPEWISDTQLVISATGDSVTFIEFGSGVHYVEQHPKASEMGAVRGGYGQNKGLKDTWAYYGDPGTNGEPAKGKKGEKGLVFMHGNPPARAMYDAGKEMRERIAEIAREVFMNDR